MFDNGTIWYCNIDFGCESCIAHVWKLPDTPLLLEMFWVIRYRGHINMCVPTIFRSFDGKSLPHPTTHHPLKEKLKQKCFYSNLLLSLLWPWLRHKRSSPQTGLVTKFILFCLVFYNQGLWCQLFISLSGTSIPRLTVSLFLCTSVSKVWGEVEGPG